MSIHAQRSASRPLDPVALARVRQRLQALASPPWLHAEIARRLADRLPVVRLRPKRVLDWSGFLGASESVLAAAYPKARIIAVETDADRRDATRAARATPWWSPRRWTADDAEVRVASEVDADCCQLLWSNMALHGELDPQAVFSAWHRALEVDGFLMFSTLGPGSLDSLRRIYADSGWGAPHAPFVDMHDLGDMLIEAGFADPVMDQETITLHWPTADALLAELRGLGGNVDPWRHAGLRTPRWRNALARALQSGPAQDVDGRPQLRFEVVYGHAFRVAPRPRLTAETSLPLADMRAMIRQGRDPR